MTKRYVCKEHVKKNSGNGTVFTVSQHASMKHTALCMITQHSNIGSHALQHSVHAILLQGNKQPCCWQFEFPLCVNDGFSFSTYFWKRRILVFCSILFRFVCGTILLLRKPITAFWRTRFLKYISQLGFHLQSRKHGKRENQNYYGCPYSDALNTNLIISLKVVVL